jgi:two-component system secretion response regulator SsrB
MGEETVRRVLLAERHHGISEGVRGLLEAMFQAVVMVSDQASLFETLKGLPVDLAVVDLSLTNTDGIHLIRKLRRQFPDLKLIVLSVHDELTVSRSALEAGANGFVLKRAIATELFEAADAVIAGRSYVSPTIATVSRSAGKY